MQYFMNRFNEYMKYGLRIGQAYYNALYDTYPNLANEITGGPLDTFFDDSKIDNFLIWLNTRLQ